MEMKYILFIVGLVAGAILVVCFVLQDIYLERKIHKLAKQNEKLRKENIGLMRHNGKIYDENQILKHPIEKTNIPDYKPW